MNVVFVSFGKGSGDLVLGIAIFFAFQRAGIDCDFTALTNCEFQHIAEQYFQHVRIRPEPEKFLKSDRQTELYRNLEELQPDLVIVNGIWVPFYPIINDFRCKKMLMIRHVPEKWFSVPMPDGLKIDINIDDYDLVLNNEPNFHVPGFININPIVIRNPGEILSRFEARKALHVPEGKKLCVVAHNGYQDEIDTLIVESGELPSDYHVVVSTNRKRSGVFPLADYARGIDLLLGGAGYNTFYETRFFHIPAELKVFNRESGEDQYWRLRTNGEFQFSDNGADEAVKKMMTLV
jgi:hypothetical protein